MDTIIMVMMLFFALTTGIFAGLALALWQDRKYR